MHSITNSVDSQGHFFGVRHLFALTHQESKLKLQVIPIPQPSPRARILLPTSALHLELAVGKELCSAIICPLKWPSAKPLPLWVDDPGFPQIHQYQGDPGEQADKP